MIGVKQLMLTKIRIQNYRVFESCELSLTYPACDAEHKPLPTPVVVQNAPGLSDELEKLAALHPEGY